MKRIKNKAEYLIPGLITLMIFMGVIAVKGIFPFGTNRIDYYDMGQTNAPLYYHMWDFLHGRTALMFDWYINEGQNLAMGSAIQWNISPFNLFWLFIPRDMVMESLSVYVGIHLAAMSIAMYIFLKKTADCPKLYLTAFSVCYGLCGYTLTHYTIPTYLDTAVFIPLLMLALYRLLHEGKTTCYALMLGFMTALSYYLGFMDIIFILLTGGAYIYIVLPREKRGDRALRLGAGTAAGTALSAFMLLPAAMQMRQSSRFNSNLSGGLFATLKSILSAIGADMYYIKWWQLSGSLLAMAVIITGLIWFRKEKKSNLFMMLFCFFPCALIPFEAINILWHFGTYYHYPIRCGYLIPFTLLTAGAYYAGRLVKLYNSGTGKKIQDTRINIAVPAAAGVITAALTAEVIKYYVNHGVWEIQELFRTWAVAAAVLFIVYLAAAAFIKKPAMALFPLAAELVICAYAGYGCPNFTDRYSSDPEQSGAYVITAQQLKEDMQISGSRTDRIKNPDTELNTNYGMIMDRATVTGWANTATRTQIDAGIAYGYSAHFTRILDAGGTVFTDSLLGINEILTKSAFEGTMPLYKKKAEADGYTLYENEASLPWGLAVNSSIADTDISKMSLTDIQNLLYHGLTSDTGDIAENETGSEFHVSGEKALYMQYGTAGEIKVNGRSVDVPTIGDTENREFPAWFNSNVLYLGTYKDEDVAVEGIDGGSITSVDLKRLRELSSSFTGVDNGIKAGKNTLEMTVSGQTGKNVALLPLNYDKGWSAEVNGRKVKLTRACGLFTGVPLENGVNKIKMVFVPDGLTAGIIVSVLALILTILFSVKPVRVHTLEEKAADAILRAVWGIALTVLYVIPVACFIVHEIVKRI